MARLLFYGVAPVAVGAAAALQRERLQKGYLIPLVFHYRLPLSLWLSCCSQRGCGAKSNGHRLPLSLWLSCCSQRRYSAKDDGKTAAFPMAFMLQQGGKPANPRELT